MQEVNKEVKDYLERSFNNVRETQRGFRINVNQINKIDLSILEGVPCTNDVLIKRSGTGLVVIIE